MADETIATPLIITSTPSYPISYVGAIWKQLVIDLQSSLFYTNSIDIEHLRDEDIVIGLLPWSEMGQIGSENLPSNVQRSTSSKGKKIFLHFPLYPTSMCEHHHIKKSKCRRSPCGQMAPFLDMEAITEAVNGYLDEGLKVLIYSHLDVDRALLFAGCCMLQAKIPLQEVLHQLHQWSLRNSSDLYLQRFADYLRSKINPEPLSSLI